MAYSNFTLQTVREAFDLQEIDTANLFAGSELMAPNSRYPRKHGRSKRLIMKFWEIPNLKVPSKWCFVESFYTNEPIPKNY